MVVLTCYECGGMASDTADACPHCGSADPTRGGSTAPHKEAKSKRGCGCFGLAGVVLLIGYLVTYYAPSPSSSDSTGVERRIFTAMVSLQDEGACEAQRLYPSDLPRQAAYIDSTSRAAYGIIARRFSVTEARLREVAVEGASNAWPMPASSC